MQGFAMGISPALYLVRELKLHCFGALPSSVHSQGEYMYQYNIRVYEKCMYLHVYIGLEIHYCWRMVVFMSSQFQVACLVVTVSPSLGRGNPGGTTLKTHESNSWMFLRKYELQWSQWNLGPGKILHSRGRLLCEYGTRRSQRAESDESRLPRKASNQHSQSPPSECCNGSKRK